MPEYIDREQAVTVFKTFYGKSLRIMLEALAEEHAADVRPVVHGEWGVSLNPCFSPFDGSGEYRYRCNQCRHIQDYESNFCPNCGAEMREEGVSHG